METFKSDSLNRKAYHNVFLQKGGSLEMDRYIYGMQGEGIGSFFGALFKQALPILESAIKGAARASKPIAAAVGKDLISIGVKRGVQELKRLTNSRVTHKPHKKIKKGRKWRNL